MATTEMAELMEAIAASTTGKKALGDIRQRNKTERQKLVDRRVAIEAEAEAKIADLEATIEAEARTVSRLESQLWNARWAVRQAEEERRNAHDRAVSDAARIDDELRSTTYPSIGMFVAEMRTIDTRIHRARFFDSEQYREAQEVRRLVNEAIVAAEALAVAASDDPEGELQAIKDTIPANASLIAR